MNPEPFIYWIRERESIRIRRERGEPPPWTTDPILANYRFCNIRREDDRVTQWIHDNIRLPYADHPNLWLMLCAARWINVPDTLAELISREAWPDRDSFKPEYMTEVLEARLARGEKVFTGAYILRSEFGMSKSKCISEITLGNLWRDRAILESKMKDTLQGAHEALTAYVYWGPFMATQAIVDMAFCDNLLAKATDRKNWIAAGPGTLRGLNYLYERPWNKILSQKQALEEMRLFNIELRKNVKIIFDWTDIPNILCETSKYIKLQRGEGKVRSRYEPKT